MEQTKNRIQLKQCPLCGNPEFSEFISTKDYFLTQEKFRIVKCNSCDFVFTNPIPSLENLSAYYDSPDYLSHTANKKRLVGIVYNYLREINLRSKYRVINRFKKAGKILDIGQGTGEFLKYMRNKDWDVLGIEPNTSARQFAIDQYNLEVYPEEKITQLPSNSFDVITMWHVLEHISELTLRMEQIKNLLDKDGVLIIAVPNLDSPDAKMYGEKWAALDVPRHLYHFTQDTVDKLLSKFGFDLLKSYPMKIDAYYVSLLSERYKKKKLLYPAALINGFRSNLMAKRRNNYSSMIFVAKQK